MLLKTTPVPTVLDRPELSANKRRAQWEQAGLPGITRETPAVNVRDLQMRYGPEQGRAPHLKEATFAVPLGTQQSTYERVRDEQIGRWLNAMQKRGWDALLDSQHLIRVDAYIYPAYDLKTKTFDLGSRQFKVRAWFVFRNPEVHRFELDPAWLQPVRAAGT